MINENTLDSQQIERLQQIALNTQKSHEDGNHNAHNRSTYSPDNAQRPHSSSSFKPHESQFSISDVTDHGGFPYLADSFGYHADRLQRSNEGSQPEDSQLSDLSSLASHEGHQAMPMMSTIPPQGGDATPFKVPSFPSISSIHKLTRSSEENESSLNGIGEASPRLSQFFHPTQESPPQVTSSPHIAEHPAPITRVAEPSPLPSKRSSTYSHPSANEDRERLEQVAAEEEPQDKEDSFGTVPEHLRRKWAMEKKAHQIFEGLRSIPVTLKSTSSQFDDLLFGTKTRLDPDGVRRVIKPEKAVSENGMDEEETTTSGDSRKRASTAPVKKLGSVSTVISNSQPDTSGGRQNEKSGNDTSHGTVVKETPLGSSPNEAEERPQSRGVEIDSSQFLDTWNEPVDDIVTPLRNSKDTIIPSSTQSTHRLALETPAHTKSALGVHHTEDSVPETSPVKAEIAESEEFRTARESFTHSRNDDEMVDSSPVVVVPGRRRVSGFVASSIPLKGATQHGRKRERAPIIQDDLSDEEIPEPPVQNAGGDKSPRKRRRIESAGRIQTRSASMVSESEDEGDGESHRVFALFQDGKKRYFPATVVEPPPAGPEDEEASLETGVLVRFDDNAESVVQLRNIRRMDLQQGDIVKLYNNSTKALNYTILRCQYDPKDPGIPDINGNNIVIVAQKARNSSALGEELRIPAEKVYLIPTLFKQFDSRRYLFTTHPKHHLPATMSRQVSSSPNITRPTMRPHSHLFRNMIFAISVNKDRDTLTKAVIMHNGHVVEDGLHEMFHMPDDVEGDLVVLEEWRLCTFAAVIADGYSRKTKYLQALALGIPCLSSKWIDNCIRQGRIMDWTHYLLPAGESDFLGGIKSMVVSPFLPDEPLSTRLQSRYMPLSDQRIVVVLGRGKANEEKRKHFHFLLTALGSKEVFRCSVLTDAEGYLSQGGISLIIADESEIRKWEGERPGIKIQSFEFVVQTLILGCFPDEL